MKKLCIILLFAPILYGCSYTSAKHETNPPTPQEQLCAELKSNLIFNTTSTPPSDTASATQRAEMMRLYHKNNCAKLKK